MRLPLTSALATAIAIAGLASGWPTAAHTLSTPAAHTSNHTPGHASAHASIHTSAHAAPTPQASFTPGVHLIEFHEPGLIELHQKRQKNAARPSPFSPKSAEAKADLKALQASQQQHIRSMQSAGIKAVPSHHYLATHSGIAVHLHSQAQLDALHTLGIVKSVRPDAHETLHTHRSASFVSAPAIWNGSAVPGGTGTLGQDMVVAILDGGIDTTHPSFANDPSCGLSNSKPKIISALDCALSDANGMCNGPDPMDNNGHGTHVASTAAGNRVTQMQDAQLQPPDGDSISGIAPCARIRSYKVCASNMCAHSDIIAGMNSVLLHDDVDVMNFSISGGTNPWRDTDRKKLDLVAVGVFVAASAGNTGWLIEKPVGKVNHLAPWITTVASSTHDQQHPEHTASAGPLSAAPPQLTQQMKMEHGLGSPTYSGAEIGIKLAASSNIDGCNAHPANFFQGKAALIQRGNCPDPQKISHAHAAGAALIVVYNHQTDYFWFDASGQNNIPVITITEFPSSNALVDFVASTPNATIRTDFAPPNGDVLSGFSLRGPTPRPFEQLTKPDITAPGNQVYAAIPGGYQVMGGTSMSSPQITGAAALLRKIHPDWTPLEVKSALMMTASTSGKKDNGHTTPASSHWDADDVGSGRLDLSKAALAGLVMDETAANFLAANPADNGLPHTLNLPSLRNMRCSPHCTWTRTVRNTLNQPANWSVEGHSPDGKMHISVSPSQFSFSGQPGETRQLTITAAPIGDQTGTVAFGNITLRETAQRSPDLHLPVAIKGIHRNTPVLDIEPAITSAHAYSGATTPVTQILRISNFGASPLNWMQQTGTGHGMVDALLVEQPVSGPESSISHYSSSLQGGATTAADFLVTGSSTLKSITVHGVDAGNSLANAEQITWVIYPDQNGWPSGSFLSTPPNDGSVWQFNAAPNAPGISLSHNPSGHSSIHLDLLAASENLQLPPGRYWLTVYPTSVTRLANNAPRWSWLQAEQTGHPSQYIGNLFGNPFWFPTYWDTGASDVAFSISAQQQTHCDTSWLSLASTSGSVAPAAHSDITVSLDPTGLPDGEHTAMLCLRSNDGGNAGSWKLVPVTFTIGGNPPPPPEEHADLSVQAILTPSTIAAGDNFTAHIQTTNHGPAVASHVSATLSLVSGMQLTSSPSAPWSCTQSHSVVSCTHHGNLSGQAPSLQLDISTPSDMVSAEVGMGIFGMGLNVQSERFDPEPNNNVSSLDFMVKPFGIFSHDFEPIIESGQLSTWEIRDPNDSKVLRLDLRLIMDSNYAISGSDIHFFTGNEGLAAHIFDPTQPGQGLVTTAPGQSRVAILTPGTTIGPDSPFTDNQPGNMQHWMTQGSSGYLGLRFFNESVGKLNYGYIEIEIPAPNTYPIKIKRYAYDVTGAPIKIQ